MNSLGPPPWEMNIIRPTRDAAARRSGDEASEMETEGGARARGLSPTSWSGLGSTFVIALLYNRWPGWAPKIAADPLPGQITILYSPRPAPGNGDMVIGLAGTWGDQAGGLDLPNPDEDSAVHVTASSPRPGGLDLSGGAGFTGLGGFVHGGPRRACPAVGSGRLCGGQRLHAGRSARGLRARPTPTAASSATRSPSIRPSRSSRTSVTCPPPTPATIPRRTGSRPGAAAT